MKKTILLGSSSGIGQAITARLLNAGEQVVGIARDHSKYQPDNNNYSTFSIDLSDTKNIEQQFKAVLKEHSDSTAVICSAGFGMFANVEQLSWVKMQEIMQVNFLAQALFVKLIVPHFKQRQEGKIIFIGSECALNGFKRSSLYSASKFALRGFAQSLRRECEPNNVAVTLINPGMVRTPFFDNLDFRPGKHDSNGILPEQIAQTVCLTLQLANNCVVEELNIQPMHASVIPTH